MSYFLFLDDIREPGSVAWVKYPLELRMLEMVIARNYDEFVKTITERGDPACISYDHDLDEVTMIGGKSTERTGYDCVKWYVGLLEARRSQHPEFFIHSMNPVGGNNIRRYIQNYHKHLSELIEGEKV